MLSALLLGGFYRVHVSQLSFISPKGATTPCGFLAPSFSGIQSPWSPGRSPQGGCGLHSLGTHLAVEGVDREAEAREALARWRSDQKLKKERDINTCGKCFWCKNRVNGISLGVPQTQKPQRWTPAGVGSTGQGRGARPSADMGCACCPRASWSHAPGSARGGVAARPRAVPSGGTRCHGGGMAGPADGPGLSSSVSGHPGQWPEEGSVPLFRAGVGAPG